jgi:hypothetical protein
MLMAGWVSPYHSGMGVHATDMVAKRNPSCNHSSHKQRHRVTVRYPQGLVEG